MSNPRKASFARLVPACAAFGCLAAFCLSACAHTGAAAAVLDADGQVTLETSALALMVKRSPDPHVAELIHKASGTALVSLSLDHAFFAIVLEREGGEDWVESTMAGYTRVEVTRSAIHSEVVITYAGLSGLDLSAEVRGTFDARDPVSNWTITVHNGTGRKIVSVRFPILSAVPAIGDNDDDFIVLPYLPGTLIRNPWEAWNVDMGAFDLRYPGALSAQFITYQDATAGIYLASRDPAGHEKQLAIWKKKDGFGLCHDYYLSANPGVNWQSPYTVSIGVTQGTWQDSADIYKQWAVRQEWCAKTLAHRSDVPQWLRNGPLVYVSSMRMYDETGREAGSFYPSLPDSLKYLKDRTDGQIVAMLADWEKNGRFIAGDYFPVFDDKNARKAIAQIKADGFRPFLYLSGLYYSFAVDAVSPWSSPAPDEFVPSFVVDRNTGEPQIFTNRDVFYSAPWMRYSYAFCIHTPLTRSFFRKLIDQALDLGVSILQIDQVTSAAGFPCFSSLHGHEPGIGLYQTQDFHALLKNMRDYGKSRDPDFVLFTEEPNELLIPHVDGFHTREYLERQWYRGYPGAVGISLFSYLYHEYAICYGGDSANIGPGGIPVVPWWVRNHTINLVTGATPGAAVWFNINQLYSADPRILAMIRNHRQLLEAGASRFLMEGRMLHPFEVDAPTLTYSGADPGEPEADFSESAILTSSWQAADGSVGHVFVNLAQSELQLEVELDTRNAPGFPLCDVSMYSSASGAQFQPLWQSVTLPRSFSTTLKPDEVLFVEIHPAKQ